MYGFKIIFVFFYCIFLWKAYVFVLFSGWWQVPCLCADHQALAVPDQGRVCAVPWVEGTMVSTVLPHRLICLSRAILLTILHHLSDRTFYGG